MDGSPKITGSTGRAATPEATRAVASDVLSTSDAPILLASDEEVDAASEAVTSILADPLLDRVRAAAAKGLCSRSLVEGTVDVVFEEDGALTILDFKTDRGPSEVNAEYERQLALYCRACAALRKLPVEGILVSV